MNAAWGTRCFPGVISCEKKVREAGLAEGEIELQCKPGKRSAYPALS